jgi:hypothetical protein
MFHRPIDLLASEYLDFILSPLRVLQSLLWCTLLTRDSLEYSHLALPLSLFPVELTGH